MSVPLISVIVPIYNSQYTLVNCIESVLSQSYTNFELLLIDDGSRDESLHLCRLYESKDNRVKVFHQKNQGVSVARNKGLEAASGTWVTFVDSDDFLPSGSFANLLRCDIDLSLGGYMDGDILKVVSTSNQIINKSQIIRLFKENSQNPLLRSIWAKFFRLEIIRKKYIFFDEGLSLGEDTIFLLKYLQYVNTGYLCSKACYVYNFESTNYSQKYANKGFDRILDYYLQVYKLSMSLGLNSNENLYCSPNFVFDIAKVFLERQEKSAFEKIRYFILRDEVCKTLKNRNSIHINLLIRLLKIRFYSIIPFYLKCISKIKRVLSK